MNFKEVGTKIEKMIPECRVQADSDDGYMTFFIDATHIPYISLTLDVGSINEVLECFDEDDLATYLKDDVLLNREFWESEIRRMVYQSQIQDLKSIGDWALSVDEFLESYGE